MVFSWKLKSVWEGGSYIQVNTVCVSHFACTSMHQNPSWEANSHATLVTVFCRARVITMSLIHILSQINSGFVLPSGLFLIFQFSILQSMPGSSKWLLSFRLYDQTCINFSLVPCMLHVVPSSSSMCGYLKPALYFVPLSSKYSPPYVVLKHCQSVFFL